ncbi:MAG TPA: energy transducer TonB [Pyrinomonadaceae bacterium]|nr:energy transducer TonB [Pyrinomonadaceae bacterium]
MKCFLFLSCTLLLVTIDALAQSARPPSDWRRYIVRDEEFSIILPTVPAMTTYKQSRSPYQNERTWRQLGVYADGVVYAIFTDDEDPQGGLKNADRRMMSRQPVSEMGVSCDGFAGKLYTFTDPVGGLIEVFATKKHFYEIQAFGASADDPRLKQFFASLRFRKDNEGIEVTDGPGTPFEPVDGSVTIPSDSVITGKQVDRKIKLVMKPEPSYTEAARQSQITGTVILKVVFSANGSVVNIEVKASLPQGLTEQSIEAAKRIKFIPAVKDGKFVPMWIQLEYNFNLY